MFSEKNGAAVNSADVSAVLLGMCLLALMVSLFGLSHTSNVNKVRVNDIQASWSVLMDSGVEGAEVVETDRFIRSMSTPVLAMQSAMRWSLAMGGLSLLLLVWHFMSARSRRRIQITSENQKMRNESAAIAKLLDEIAPLASGDLSVRASAREGAVGALADAFNYSVQELQNLAEMQLSTSRALAESINRKNESAEIIENQCTQQIVHIHQSSNSLLGMSTSMGEMSACTADTSTATQALLNVADGVANTMQLNSTQLDGLRRDSDMAIMLMQSIDQHAKAFDDVVSVLRNLSQRADLFVVNTTIRASCSNSDAVSEDVGRLSDEIAGLVRELNLLVDEIGSSIDGINTDTSEVSFYLRRINSAYEVQTSQAHTLIEAIAQVCTHSRHVHAQTVQMAEQTVVHATVVKDLSDSMNRMSRITEQTAKDAHDSAVAMAGLKKMSNELRQSTSDFNLPDGQVVSLDASQFKSCARHAAERAAING